MCLCLMLCVYVFLLSVRYKNKTVRHAKLRESVGIVESKKVLRSALLNIDGLSEASLASYEKLG